MTWYLKVQELDQERTFTLIDSFDEAELDKLSRSLAEARGDDVVRIPARMIDQLREAPMFVRPGRWIEWQFFHHDPDMVE